MLTLRVVNTVNQGLSRLNCLTSSGGAGINGTSCCFDDDGVRQKHRYISAEAGTSNATTTTALTTATTTTTAPLTTTTSISSRYIKPYQEIPGPRGLFGLGNLYQYLPYVGSYSWQTLHKAGLDKYQKYGSIVRETMVPGTDIVWVYEPEDINIVLNERQYPQRRSHLALEKYRKDRPHIYRTAGLLPTNGVDWWRLRSELQKEMSSPRTARDFLGVVDVVTHEFIEHLPNDESFDILPELSRLNLELTCAFTFGKRLHAFSPQERCQDSRSTRLIQAAETTNSCVLPTDQGFQLWRWFPTPAFKRLVKAQEYMESIALDFVEEHFDNSAKQLNTSLPMSRSCLISAYMKNSKLDRSDIVGMASDLLLAGIDTTSYASAFAIYHVACNPEVQERLYEESKRLLPNTYSSILPDGLSTMTSYGRAVLKEVFRINPVSVGVGRILNSDLVLSGYHVPKGTVVVTQNMVACRLEKNFLNPMSFMPERWLSAPQNQPSLKLQCRTAVNPYLVLPFGHGQRACIARRLAEQNILVLLLRLLRNYEIVWTGGDEPLDVKTLLINKPSRPVQIKLKTRY